MSNKKYNEDWLVKSATYASTTVAAIILITKIYGYYHTASLSIFASLLDSLLDITASVINLVAVHFALQPPDDNHRFGHEKAQDLAVFTQSLFFIASALLIAYNAIENFLNPEPLHDHNLGIAVMGVSIILTLALVIYQKYVLSKTNSSVIEADSLHYIVDFASNLGVVMALYFAKYFNLTWLDPLFALLIAIYITKSAWVLLARSFNNLMDHEFSNEEKEKIIELVKSHPQVKGFHDLKTRYAGHKPFIQIHIELDGNLTLNEVHKISHEVMDLLSESFSNGDIIIHQDPEGVDEIVEFPEKQELQS